jgi:PPK2 family polyphosphate:nucleotide phosphotransferase
MASKLSDFRITSGKKFTLADFDASAKPFSNGDKAANLKQLAELGARIDALQDVFYAEHKRKLLIVLQGMDTSGKDGTVRAVFSQADPLGLHVAAFKVPTPQERDHDYLWRVHQAVPGAGEITLFNRSHYESVLIERVHEWIDAKECKRRYVQINDFERLLTETGTTLIKCYLHISKDEQKKRLEERLADGTKHWKFDPNDLKEREYWEAYMQAYEAALAATSTELAPWHVIPSNSKTHRNLMIATLIVETLEAMKPAYPAPKPEYFKLKVE